MREAWRGLMFADPAQAAKATRDPLAPAKRSDAALAKVACHTLDDGTKRTQLLDTDGRSRYDRPLISAENGVHASYPIAGAS